MPELEPHRELTPAACTSIVQALDIALETLGRWGVRIPRNAALHSARDWLSELGMRDELNLSVRELKRTSEAAALAVDLYHISTTLGNDINSVVSSELSYLVRGMPTTTTATQDFIAQFWVGTLLAQSKLKPRILAFERQGASRPDFIAEWGTMEFAVEVKCPKSSSSARRALGAAADQLRGVAQPGVIALDVTYALGLDPTHITSGHGPIRDQFRDAHGELHASLVQLIREYHRSDKYSRVAILFTFARFWSWDIGPEPVRDSGIVFTSTPFSGACSGLIVQHSDGFQNSLPEGLRQLTGNSPELQWRET